MAETPSNIVIPAKLLPSDGRFGSGPSKVRHEAMSALEGAWRTPMGTSHRQAPVKNLVAQVQANLAQFFSLPEGYEIVMGVGGSNAFWDVATFSLISQQAQNLVYGEFTSKFATSAAAPFLTAPQIVEAPAGSIALPEPREGIDLYAWAQNETSTGAMAPVKRVYGDDGALTVIDATSSAGGLRVDLNECDVYYFAPQKSFASDGGLWFAILSPVAIERAERIKASGRWIPPFLDLVTAIENSRKHQTYNTPAIATYFLMNEQLKWLNENGGMEFAANRCAASAKNLYDWAENFDGATPFVSEKKLRSHVVGTIDFDDRIDAASLAKTLRTNGIVDVEPYRKLGRNQLRIGMYPAVDPEDVNALVASVTYVLERV